jgi:hypothetical protein
LYDKDHYERQDEIYKTIRPTLLSNTLVVPTQKIREHIVNLSANDYFGIRQQIEAFHRTNKKISRTKFFILFNKKKIIHLDQQLSLTPVDIINHLKIYYIEINYIATNQLDARYLLIEGKFFIE